MIKKYQFKNVTWVDMQSPTAEEVKEVVTEYGVGGLVAQELLVPSAKPKVDVFPDHLYLILHFPKLKKNKELAKSQQEIDFVIGKNFLITSHFEPIETLQNFEKLVEVNSILDRGEKSNHAGYLFYHLIKTMYRHLLDETEYIHSALVSAEDKIFHGQERKMVFKLSEINRDILTFRQAISMHNEVLTSFDIAGGLFFGKDFTYHLKDIVGEYYKVQNSVQGCKEFLEELRTTNDSLLTTKQNEIMKNLTIIAFIFLPLSFIGQLFGMSLRYLPAVLYHPNAFWEILLGMAALAVLIFGYFKHKKWL